MPKAVLFFQWIIPIFKGTRYELEVFDMKKFCFAAMLSLLLAVPVSGSNGLIMSDGGGGTRGNTGHSTIGGNTGNGEISVSLAHYILEMAAPQFGVTSSFLIRKYHSNCACVTITQTGTHTYAVTYGGVTIQILIESGSNDHPSLRKVTRSVH